METKKTFIVPAIMTRISSMKDGGLSIGFATNELNDEEKLQAMGFHNSFGYLLFAENVFNAVDIPKEDADDQTKTPSKRLRSVLYVLSQQLKVDKKDFNQWYNNKMEDIINQIKLKLD